ncbi:MAG: hypothetical protein DI539_18570 [Flavobacterium psychrophilum]|nr:MAG: hypothetical protein DI539_18570 [Flavobacterium psychrophilum]
MTKSNLTGKKKCCAIFNLPELMKNFMVALFSVLLLAGLKQASCQTANADSVKQVLAHPQSDTSRLRILEYLANTQPEGAWQYYNDQLLDLAEKKVAGVSDALSNTYLAYLATAYNNKGVALKYKGETGMALTYGIKALNLFESLKDSLNIANAYYNNGRLFNSLGNISKALSSLYQSLKLYEKLGQTENQTYNLNIIGSIYKEQGESKKAIENHNKALAIALSTHDKQSIAFTYACLGQVYVDEKDYPRSLDYFHKQIALFKDLNIDQDVANGYFSIGSVCKFQNRFKEANDNYNSARVLFKKIGDTNGESKCIIGIGQVLLLEKNYKEAETYFRQGLALGKSLGYPKDIHLSADGLYKIYKQTGAVAQALAMLELSKTMSDSIQNTATNKAVLKSQYKYEFEKKSIADSIQAVEDKRLFNAKIDQARIERYLLLTGFALLLVIAFLIVLRITSMQKIGELNLRNKIANDLHDDMGSALSSISIFSEVANRKMDTNQTEAKEVITKIGNTSRTVLEDMGDIVWTISPRNDSMKTLIERMNSFAHNILNEVNIRYTFKAEEQIQLLKLSMQQRKNMYLIFKEAVNNASKYSKAHSIEVVIRLESKNLEMIISDNGVGFETHAITKGNGLDNMQHRAMEIRGRLDIESNSLSGTTIRLNFRTA